MHCGSGFWIYFGKAVNGLVAPHLSVGIGLSGLGLSAVMLMTQRISELVAIGCLLSLGILCLLFWFFISNFNGLSSATALEQAQIARHLSLGHGFRTSVVRPICLGLPSSGAKGYKDNIHAQQDRFYAPLHPLVTAIAFVVLGRNDRAAAASSAFFYLLTMVPLFLLARNLFSLRAGILAVILFATAEPALRYAISGLEVSLATFLFTLLIFYIHRNGYYEGEGALGRRKGNDRLSGFPRFSGWLRRPAFWLSGFLFGLCCLASFAMVIFVLPLLFCVTFAQERGKIKCVAAFLVGLILITAPWLVRNYIVSGNPFFTLQEYQLVTSTSDYPGSTVYRRQRTDSFSPLWFILSNPGQIAGKALNNLNALYLIMIKMVHPAIVGFFLVGMFYRFEEIEAELLRICFYIMFILLMPIAVLTVVTSSLFAPLVPILIAFASGCFIRHLDRIQFQEKVFQIRSLFLVFTSGHARGAIVCTFVVVCAFPLLFSLAMGEEKVDNPLPQIGRLKSIIPPDAVVISDIPWAVAWHAERTSLWLPELKKGKQKDSASKSKIDAIYLSPTVRNYGEAEKVEGYKNMFLGQSQPFGFEQGKLLPELGVLFLRKSGGAEP